MFYPLVTTPLESWTPTAWPKSSSRDDKHHHVLIQITSTRVEFLRFASQFIEVTKIGTLCRLLQGLLPGLLDPQPKVVHEKNMKHQHFQSLSEVVCTQKHGARLRQRSPCRHGEVKAFCRHWNISWEVFFLFFFHKDSGGISLKFSMSAVEEGCLAVHFKVIIF